MRPTFCIMLDSFRPKDIDDSTTPFLSALKNKSVIAEIIPPFSFEPDAAYIAGLYPEESDRGTDSWLSPPPVLVESISIIAAFLDRLPARFTQTVRHLVRAWYRFGHYPPARKYFTTMANIPFELLKYFDIVSKQMMFEDHFCRSKTVFEIIREQGGSWKFLGHPFTASSMKAIYVQCLKIDIHRTNFIFVMAPELDKPGHVFGPASPERKNALKTTDSYLNQIFGFLESNWRDFNFIIFSDHGMAEVQGVLNVEAELSKLPLVVGQEYVYFLDSTLARFWFFSDKAENLINGMLNRLNGGAIINEKEKAEYRIRYNHNKFGNTIYWADGGNIILPNFYQGQKCPKGMHGYRSDCADNHAVYISYSSTEKRGKTISGCVPMVRIFPSILKNHGIHSGKFTRLKAIDP